MDGEEEGDKQPMTAKEEGDPVSHPQPLINNAEEQSISETVAEEPHSERRNRVKLEIQLEQSGVEFSRG